MSEPTVSSPALPARRAAPLGILALLLLLPLLIDVFYLHWIQTLAIYTLVVVGLAIATLQTGLISVGHAAIMAGGAYGAAYLSANLDVPMMVALPFAVLVAMGLGLLQAIPSGRLEHFYFAMVTLGLALVTDQLLLLWEWTGGYSGIFGIARPDLFGWELGPTQYYVFTILLTAGVVLIAQQLLGSRWGRSFLMVRDDEIAAAAVGILPYSTKLRAFVASSVPAGLAGALFAYLNHVVTPDFFSLHLGLFFLLAVVLGGQGSLWGSIVGVLLLFALPEALREWRVFTNIIFGVLLIAVLGLLPGGINQGLHHLKENVRSRFAERRGKTIAGKHELELRMSERPAFLAHDPSRVELIVAGASKNFGGNQALDGVDAVFRGGTVTAIIGPNGSGKTTLLNIVSAFYHPDEGELRLGGEPLSKIPAKVARLGVGRTFQTPKVLTTQSVLENVKAGLAASGRASMLEAALLIGRARSDARTEAERAQELLRYVGLEDRAGDTASGLPHPHLRFLEIARALATAPQVMLLDEPAAGLSSDEVEHLNRLVRDLADAGVAVVIVEHNIGLVLDVADHILVMDRGTVIAEGQPREVQADPEVARVYLGEDWAEDLAADPAKE